MIITNLNKLSKNKQNISNNDNALITNKLANLKQKQLKPNSKRLAETCYVHKTKHYPVASKEWSNSVYTYDKNTNKTITSQDKTISRLIKAYFNSYSCGLETNLKRIKSRRLRWNKKKTSINKIVSSKAEVKHNNDKAIITVYVYNGQKNYYLNKLKKIDTIFRLFTTNKPTYKKITKFIVSKINKYINYRLNKGISNLGYKNFINKKTGIDTFFSEAFKRGLYLLEFPNRLIINPNNNRFNINKFRSNKNKKFRSSKIRKFKVVLTPLNNKNKNLEIIKFLKLKKTWGFKKRFWASSRDLGLGLEKRWSLLKNVNKLNNLERNVSNKLLLLREKLKRHIISVYSFLLLRNKNKPLSKSSSLLGIKKTSNNMLSNKKKSNLKLSNNVISKHMISNKILYPWLKENEGKLFKKFSRRFFRREIVSVYLKQLLRFNAIKFQENYVSVLADQFRNLYKKRVEFNFVNLKYPYLDSSIFSNIILKKLKYNKKIYPKILSKFISMFSIRGLNESEREAMYNEMYRKEWIVKNLGLYSLYSGIDLNRETNHADVYNSEKQFLDTISSEKLDVLDVSVSKLTNKYLESLNINKHTTKINLQDNRYKLIKVIKSIKHKSLNGIRIQLSGRLSRYNTASRSMSSLKYKGNIRNIDSSDKRLSTVSLRGYTRSNLQQSKLNSKVSTGSFGLKGWISSK